MQLVDSHNIAPNNRQQHAPIPAVKASSRGVLKVNVDDNPPAQYAHRSDNMNKEEVHYEKELQDQQQEQISNLDDKESSPANKMHVNEVEKVKSPKPDIVSKPANKVPDTPSAHVERKHIEDGNIESNNEKAVDHLDEDTGPQALDNGYHGESPHQPVEGDQETPVKEEGDDQDEKVRMCMCSRTLATMLIWTFFIDP